MTQCVNNLKQLGFAIGQYNSDFSDYYPPDSIFGSVWVEAFKKRLKYIPSYDVARCPSFQGTLEVQDENSEITCGYGYNYMVLEPKTNRSKPVRSNRCTAPSAQFILLETHGTYYGIVFACRDTRPEKQDRQVMPNHGKDTLNISYADGHVDKFIAADPLNCYGSIWADHQKPAPGGYLGQCGWAYNLADQNTVLGWSKFR